MKWAVVLAVILLGGCYWLVDDTYDPSFAIPATGAATPYEVCRWVDTRVQYLSDEIHDKLDYWQSPDQTYEWGRGDCEDYSILVLYLIRRDLGGWPQLVIGDCYGNRHGWVEYEGRWWEAQTGSDCTNSPAYVPDKYISYGEVMWRSTHAHRSISDD